MVLATGVLVRALHERANFYSASAYLALSSACLMVRVTDAMSYVIYKTHIYLDTLKSVAAGCGQFDAWLAAPSVWSATPN